MLLLSAIVSIRMHTNCYILLLLRQLILPHELLKRGCHLQVSLRD